MSRSEFWTFIENMACEYHGDTYHLICKNCNHFRDDVSLRLTGEQIPGWVNRLAKLEDEFVEFLSTATPRDSTEIDDEVKKHLLSTSDGTEDVIFVKEAHAK